MVTLVTKTLQASGGDFTSWATWEAATDDNLVSADEIQELLVAAGEFIGGTLAGATTDSTRYRRVTFQSGDQHIGTEVTGARFAPASTGNCFTVGEDFSRWIGLGVQSGTDDSDECFRLGVSGGDDGNTITVRDSICIANGQAAGQADCFNVAFDTTLNTSNNVYKNFDRTIVEGDQFIAWTSDSDTSYNCAQIYRYLGGTDCEVAITAMLHDAAGGDDPFLNDALVNIVVTDSIFSSGTADTDSATNLTLGATFGTATDGSVDVIWTDLTGGSEDLHLVANANNDAQDYVTGGQATTVDFEGDVRPTTHDAGFDEFVPAVSSYQFPVRGIY